MRNKLKELNVDFIGDGKALTKEEELAISEFIRKLKVKQKKKRSVNKNNKKSERKGIKVYGENKQGFIVQKELTTKSILYSTTCRE